MSPNYQVERHIPLPQQLIQVVSSMGDISCAFSLLSKQYGLEKWHPCTCILSFQMDQSPSPFPIFTFWRSIFVSSLSYKGHSPWWCWKMYFTVRALFCLQTKFGLSLCPNTKWSFLKHQCDGTSILSFVAMQKSWIIIFSHWLFEAYFASGRDDWQTVIHVVSDKVTDVIKYMILGPDLEKEVQSI